MRSDVNADLLAAADGGSGGRLVNRVGVGLAQSRWEQNEKHDRLVGLCLRSRSRHCFCVFAWRIE